MCTGEPAGTRLRLFSMKPSTVTALGGVAVLLAGCGRSGQQLRGAAPAAPRVATLLSGTARQVVVWSLDAQGMADAQRSLGADLLKAVCGGEGSGNVTVSPASVALALGQLGPLDGQASHS